MSAARLAAIRCAKTWGTVCFVGEGGDVTIDVSRDMLRKQLTIIGSWTFSAMGQLECARFAVDNGVDVDALFSHRWKLEQVDEAYRLSTRSRPAKESLFSDAAGYVGVGLMGLPMVKRLLSRGHAVTAYDIVPEKTEAARAAGAKAAQSPAEAAMEAETVLLNLPTTEAVEQAVFGERGVASAVKPPQLVIDFSTVKVEKGKAFAEKLRAKTGCGWVDAPVSGRSAGFRQWHPHRDGRRRSGRHRARAAAHGGHRRSLHARRPAGRGARCQDDQPADRRLRHHAVMAEALVLAETAGIDASRVPDCLAGGHADGSLLQKLYPRMVKRDFAPQGYARQLLKDLEMVNELLGGLKAPAPMMRGALALPNAGAPRLLRADAAAVYKLYEKEKAK